MKAMVMAAGAGTRLQPLTYSVPKPMVPVANRPVLEYTLDNLRKHGIMDVALNLHSHPAMIKAHFGDGKRWGMKLHYSHEPKLRGTAGGVKKVASFLKGHTFLVMSGDGLTDIDLSEFIAFHKKNRSIGSMALKAVDSRFEYGVTFTSAGGRITRFAEKPLWSDVYSNHVNTGVYAFESSTLGKIPAGQVYDFGHDLWPKLLKQKARIYGHLISAYWCDVGNLSEYRRAQKDVLDGKVHVVFPGRRVRENVWVDEHASIESSVKIEGPCLIGKNSHIGRGARLGAYTVIGNNVRIGKNVTLNNSTLWNNIQIGDNTRLDNCIIRHNTQVPGGLSLHDGIL